MSSYFNFLARQHYLWARYLSDGILQGEHEIQGGGLIVEDDVEIGGLYKRPTRVRHIPATAGQQVAGTMDSSQWGAAGEFDYDPGSSGDTIIFPLALEEGERLLSVDLLGFAAATSEYSLRIWRTTIPASGSGSITKTQLGSTVANSVAGQYQTTTVSGLTEVVGTARTFLHAEVTFAAPSPSIYGLLVHTDVP